MPAVVLNEDIQLLTPAEVRPEALHAVIRKAAELHYFPIKLADRVQTTAAAARFLIECEKFNKGGQKLYLFIQYKKELAGSVALPRIDRQHLRAELGYWLRPDLQGIGIIHVSAGWLIRHAFYEQHLQRLEIRVISKNEKGRAVPQRLGFQYEGTARNYMRWHNQFVDMENYALLKTDVECLNNFME